MVRENGYSKTHVRENIMFVQFDSSHTSLHISENSTEYTALRNKGEYQISPSDYNMRQSAVKAKRSTNKPSDKQSKKKIVENLISSSSAEIPVDIGDSVATSISSRNVTEFGLKLIKRNLRDAGWLLILSVVTLDMSISERILDTVNGNRLKGEQTTSRSFKYLDLIRSNNIVFYMTASILTTATMTVMIKYGIISNLDRSMNEA
uniref:Uncharacterized protein n=1 Tax=Glossina palpalis gambiensis TaxID=67801 RepID=A0A1B0C694_9MUSC